MANSMTEACAFRHGNTSAPEITRVMPLFSLKGRTAIVSGAGAGIGLAVAQAFAEAGANVILWYYTNEHAVERAAEIEKEYGVKCNSHSRLFLPNDSVLLFLSVISQRK
jgi:sorbose reductase